MIMFSMQELFLSGLDPNQTNYLSLAVKAGTIRGAAEILGVEPSTVSRQISSLENHLGITLIERGRKGVFLTEAGELLQTFLRRQSGELEALQSEFSALKQIQRGTISISVGEGFVGDLISKSLASFARQYPGISYNLQCGSTKQVMHDIKTDQAHLGLAYNSKPDRQLKTLKHVEQPLKLLISPKSDLINLKEPISIEDLSDIPCAILNKGLGIGTMLNSVEGLLNIHLNSVIQTNSIAVLKNFVRENMGISFLPEFVVIREILDKQIIAKKVIIPELNLGEAHLIMRQGRRLPDSVIKLSTHIQRSMSVYQN